VKRLLLLLLFFLCCAVRVHAQQAMYGGGANAVPPTPSPPPVNPITHVIVVVQENRSLDNLFTGFPGATTNCVANLYPTGTQNCASFTILGGEWFDSGHNHSDFVSDMDGSGGGAYGPNNGFGQAFGGTQDCNPADPNFKCTIFHVADNHTSCTQGGTFPNGCTNLNYYWGMASAGFGMLADEAFQTNQGPSTTAHCYLVAAQCGYPTGSADQERNGCANPKQNVDTIGMTGTYPGTVGTNAAYSCMDFDTIFDEMSAKGLTSEYYWSLNGFTNFWNPDYFINHICNPTLPLGGSSACQYNGVSGHTNTQPETTFLTDACAGYPGACTNPTCTLKNLSYVTPSATDSDHEGAGCTNGAPGCPANNGTGPAWVGMVVNAVGTSPCWNSSLIIITWDDWGGIFDDQVPPRPTDAPNDPYEYSYRVPLMLISPYISHPDTVDHTTRDAFGSIVRSIEYTFALGPDPQCTGTLQPTPSGGIGGAFVPAGPPFYGLCQRDNRGSIIDTLYGNINTGQSPTAFSPVALAPNAQMRAIAGTSDNGASLAVQASTPQARAFVFEAMAYARAASHDTFAYRTTPPDTDDEDRP